MSGFKYYDDWKLDNGDDGTGACYCWGCDYLVHQDEMDENNDFCKKCAKELENE